MLNKHLNTVIRREIGMLVHRDHNQGGMLRIFAMIILGTSVREGSLTALVGTKQGAAHIGLAATGGLKIGI